MAYIKPQTVIPPDIKITRCPPSVGKGRSIWSLVKEEERRLENQVRQAEYDARYQEARAAGMTVAEAAVYATKK